MKRLTDCCSCQSLRRRCRCCRGTASGRRRNTSSPQSRAFARLKGTVAYQGKDMSSPQSTVVPPLALKERRISRKGQVISHHNVLHALSLKGQSYIKVRTGHHQNLLHALALKALSHIKVRTGHHHNLFHALAFKGQSHIKVRTGHHHNHFHALALKGQ
jgi:hypothetical protein